MARLTKASEVELNNWKDRINVSHRFHEVLMNNYRIFKKYYQGDQWLDLATHPRFLDHVVDNVVFANIRTIVPKLNFRNPHIFVSPLKKPHKLPGGQFFDTTASAMAMELLLNHYYRTLRTKRETRKCLYDALIGYYGILEIGYTLKTEKIIGSGKDKGDLREIDEIIKEASPFMKRRAFEDFRRDPEGNDHLLQDDRWIALRWLKSLDDIKTDPRYENTKHLKPNFRFDTNADKTVKAAEYEANSVTGDPTIWDKVEGWTVWDKRTRRRLDIVEGHDRFLRNAPWPKWTNSIEGFPVEILYMNENPDNPEPVADISIYKKTQDEINQIGSMMLSHIRRISQRRYLANETALDSTEEFKLQHGADGVIVKTKGNPESKVIPLQDAGISQDIYIVQRNKKQEISEMSGVSSLERSQIAKFETATEPALLNQNSQTIRDDQRSLFEDFITRSVKKLSAILKETLDKNKTIPLSRDQFQTIRSSLTDEALPLGTRKAIATKLEKIVGEDGSISLFPWLTLSSDDIKADYNFEVEVGSTAPVNSETRKRDAITMGQALAGNPFINQQEATRKFLEVFEVKDIEKIMKTDQQIQQDQQVRQAVQTQDAQVEIQKKQLDIQKAREKNETNIITTLLKEGAK